LRFRQFKEAAMFYPWPGHKREGVLFEALDIAVYYLTRTGQTDPHVEALAASLILGAYNHGIRHRIALANYAIVRIERASRHDPAPALRSVYPRMFS
jgi:hypothetical protein